jgi:hypothetical protein
VCVFLVIIGDTSSSTPLAVIRNIHMQRMTDITWSGNGLALMVSSNDGYCSIITFEKGELGEEFIVEPDKFPALTRNCFPVLPPILDVKKEKPKATRKKTLKEGEDVKTPTAKEKGAKKSVSKTPTTPSTKKKQKEKDVVESKNIVTMFTQAGASPKPESGLGSTPQRGIGTGKYTKIYIDKHFIFNFLIIHHHD